MQARERSLLTTFAAGTASDAKQTHPLLGVSLSTVWTNRLFEARLGAHSPAYLVDHQVQGSAVTPAAAYIEQGLAAADEVFGPGKHGLANITIQQAMFLPEAVRRRRWRQTASRPARRSASAAPSSRRTRGRSTAASTSAPPSRAATSWPPAPTT